MLLKHRGVLSSSVVRGWERLMSLMSQRCPSTIPRRAVDCSLVSCHASAGGLTQKSGEEQAVARGLPSRAKHVIRKHTNGAKALFHNLS